MACAPASRVLRPAECRAYCGGEMAGESKKLYSPYGPVNEPKIPLLAARALAKIGRSTEAIAILADMLSVIEPTSHLSMKPDVCSLKGDLLLIDGPSQQAEAADNYRQA